VAWGCSGCGHPPSAELDRCAQTECVQRCEQISLKLAAFSEACEALPQDGTFECFNLDTLPDERGGCAEPWCHAMPEGQGVAGPSGIGQGWERGEPLHFCAL